MECDALEFGETVKKKPFRYLISVRPSVRPSFHPWIWKEYCQIWEPWQKNPGKKWRSQERNNKFCGLILPRDIKLQLDVSGMKHRLNEKKGGFGAMRPQDGIWNFDLGNWRVEADVWYFMKTSLSRRRYSRKHFTSRRNKCTIQNGVCKQTSLGLLQNRSAQLFH